MAGEPFPVLTRMLPRLKKGGLTLSVFAVCGDAVRQPESFHGIGFAAAVSLLCLIGAGVFQ